MENFINMNSPKFSSASVDFLISISTIFWNPNILPFKQTWKTTKMCSVNIDEI